ncbi:rCG47363 [Rattus norvegicus]|uniref:RCG47363 n=1 Tax=Rattus norvegicus TaxID=10116 RepID=A6HXL7_RAT|nr:rCG47363 [Rattus norvegicus]
MDAPRTAGAERPVFHGHAHLRYQGTPVPVQQVATNPSTRHSALSKFCLPVGQSQIQSPILSAQHCPKQEATFSGVMTHRVSDIHSDVIVLIPTDYTMTLVSTILRKFQKTFQSVGN